MRLPSGEKLGSSSSEFQSVSRTGFPPPRLNQKLTISWFEPNGKLLGSASKPSGPTVTSSIKSNAALPRGAWRVDLRSGGTLVKSVAINVQ